MYLGLTLDGGKYMYIPMDGIQKNLACTTLINAAKFRTIIIVASKVSKPEWYDIFIIVKEKLNLGK